MFEIRGKLNTAICYAAVVEEQAVGQIVEMLGCPFTENCRVRIMPDVHAGRGCTIGTTMTVLDKACPNVVGVDIGCGMYTVRLNEREIDFAAVDAAAHAIPSGMNVWEKPLAPFGLSALRCAAALKETARLRCSLGTLGGGNHFIEIDRAADGALFLVIHSGSRNLGKQVAEYYQALAVEQRRGKPEFLRKRQELIREYRACGREKEISRALLALKAEYEAAVPAVPEDLCWLTGDALRDYLNDVAVCQRFARRSRELMAETLLAKAGLTGSQAFHTVHNYIDTEEMILRKGAIAAHAGEKVLIPINMRDGSILAVGKGNPEWNYSAPHGAGRVMSRSAAVNTLSMEEYRRSMEGVYTTSVNEHTLDESPMAYKRLSDIVDVIGDTVEILEVLRPVYNFKASSETPPWAK